MITIDDGHHDLLRVGDGNLLVVHHHDQLDKLLVAEVLLNNLLEIHVLPLNVAIDVLVNPSDKKAQN